MRKKLSASLLCAALVLSMLPTVARAADPPASFSGGVGMLTAPETGGNVKTDADIVRYGGQSWYVLSTSYAADDSDASKGSGALLLSRYAYSFRTQWMAYHSSVNSGDAGGYLGSDIRGYLNGSNTRSETYTPIRNVQYYNGAGHAPTNTSNARSWMRTKADGSGSGPWYVKDDAQFTLSTSAVTLSEENFNTVLTNHYNELYTKVTAATEGAIEYNGEYYKEATEGTWTDGTSYYWDMTPYKQIDGYDANRACYTFSIAKQFGTDESNSDDINMRKICWYGGYYLMALDSYQNHKDSQRVHVAGQPTKDHTFAMDLNLNDADLSAILKTTRAAQSGTSNNISYKGGALQGDTFFLLSGSEATDPDYGMGATNNRGTMYVGETVASIWWLRSSVGSDTVAYIDSTNNSYATTSVFKSAHANAVNVGIRPAFNLDPAAVLFTSAVNGKPALATGDTAKSFSTDLVSAATTEHRLTLTDSGIAAPIVTEQEVSNNAVSVSWTGGPAAATTDIDGTTYNNYVSAIIVGQNDDISDGIDQIYGYVKLGDSATGSATVTLPEGITGLGEESGYEIYLFNEQCSSVSSRADYVSALRSLSDDYFVEVTANYIADYSLVQVYTDSDMPFTYGADKTPVCFDVVQKGYKRTGDDTAYRHVYALIVAGEANPDAVAPAASQFEITTLANGPNDADVNGEGEIDIMDLLAVTYTANGNGTYTGALATYMANMLGADVDGDRDVDADDVAQVRTAIFDSMTP